MSRNRNTTVDRAQIELNWRQRGFSCGLWVDPPGQVWEDYVHQTDELVMLVEGTLELEFEGRRFRPEIGEEVLIPALVCHTVQNVGEGRLGGCTGINGRRPSGLRSSQ
jgi:mannose-6-phosphate isomerase-like protein (cupin superfamily)